MNKLPNHTALKEWASAIAALGRGDQVILIRKGGIADPKFGLEAKRFYLFPTNFHEGEDSRPPLSQSRTGAKRSAPGKSAISMRCFASSRSSFSIAGRSKRDIDSDPIRQFM